MDNAIKHLEKLHKQITLKFGKEQADKILTGLDYLSGEESSTQIAQWAEKLTKRLEESIEEQELISIREECACIKANKYSTYNTKYFKELRAKHQEDIEYMQAVAEFLDGRGRAGRKVEYREGVFYSHFSFGNSCVCYVIKGGWKNPPSTTWCRCCQGTLKSIFQFVFPEKLCNMDIIETFATDGKDCIFKVWYTDK
ncbi:DUF6144 family protein [Anaerocolumna sp. MB42-C2]|uniref:DUF6144 family protein n=1 Tax=Anaerocolumna sp. MB42-C2 TaxID=3070997 RepID=UPI0027E089DE|nr:DUF6144 family protein [Anaerocolumna sp. MB42-C2]WMJ88561.1 DUF6144 family protein [Anaerocolumna sp. MB42-C2]